MPELKEHIKFLETCRPNSIFVGDFNCNHQLWGSDSSDNKAHLLLDWIENNNFCIFNTGEGTRFNTINRTTSCIDLTIVPHMLASLATWGVSQDLCGSDHFPIFTTLDIQPWIETVNLPKRYIFDKAHWHKYRAFLNQHTTEILVNKDINEQLNTTRHFGGQNIANHAPLTQRVHLTTWQLNH